MGGKAASPQKARASQKHGLSQQDYFTAIAEMQLAQLQHQDTATQRAYVKNLKQYAAENRHNRKSQPAILLSLEYARPAASGKQVLLVPATTSAGHADLSALQKIAPSLNGLPYTLQNIHASRIGFTPAKTAALGKEEQWASDVQKQQEQLLSGAAPLADAEAVRLHLDAAKIFMQARLRDPAYIAMENAKHAVARLTQQAPSETADTLSKEAADLEEMLRKEMPYEL